MFQIEQMDPKTYQSQTRKATLKVMGIFFVIGLVFANLFPMWLGEYFSSQLMLNFIGAFVGLMITAYIVKGFFSKAEWMKEAIYGWRLKRHLMYVTNRQRHIEEAAKSDDEMAMRILRFYHLGLEQMHRLEGNSTALIDLKVPKEQHEARMLEKGMELEQLTLDPEWVEAYKEGAIDND